MRHRQQMAWFNHALYYTFSLEIYAPKSRISEKHAPRADFDSKSLHFLWKFYFSSCVWVRDSEVSSWNFKKIKKNVRFDHPCPSTPALPRIIESTLYSYLHFNIQPDTLSQSNYNLSNKIKNGHISATSRKNPETRTRRNDVKKHTHMKKHTARTYLSAKYLAECIFPIGAQWPQCRWQTAESLASDRPAENKFSQNTHSNTPQTHSLYVL